MRKTVACCKHVLKDYWKSLRIDFTDKSEIWIEEAKHKRSVKSSDSVTELFFTKHLHDFRALAPLENNEIRPTQYELTPTLDVNRTEEQTKKLQEDIKCALQLAVHQKPLERG